MIGAMRNALNKTNLPMLDGSTIHHRTNRIVATRDFAGEYVRAWWRYAGTTLRPSNAQVGRATAGELFALPAKWWAGFLDFDFVSFALVAVHSGRAIRPTKKDVFVMSRFDDMASKTNEFTVHYYDLLSNKWEKETYVCTTEGWTLHEVLYISTDAASHSCDDTTIVNMINFSGDHFDVYTHVLC